MRGRSKGPGFLNLLGRKCIRASRSALSDLPPTSNWGVGAKAVLEYMAKAVLEYMVPI